MAHIHVFFIFKKNINIKVSVTEYTDWRTTPGLDMYKMVLYLNHVWPVPDKIPQNYQATASGVKGHKLVEAETMSSTEHLYSLLWKADPHVKEQGLVPLSLCIPHLLCSSLLSGIFFLSSFEAKSDAHISSLSFFHPSGSLVNLFLLCTLVSCGYVLRLCVAITLCT